MRQRKLKWADEFLDNCPNMINEFPFDLSTLNGQIELEIGCGKGDFITKKALSNPSINYIGFDIQKSCLAISAKKAVDSEIKNVHFLYANAKEMNDKIIGKFDNIYLNFSDPWPKARHEKRRLTSPIFLNIYNQYLKDGGKIIMRTDNKGLYEYSLESISSMFDIVENEPNCILHEGDIISEYETKFRAQGNPIYKIVAKRR